MIKKQEVKTFIEHLKCDECGEEMAFTGEAIMTYPPKFTHICMNCENKIVVDKVYPSTSYEYIDSNE